MKKRIGPLELIQPNEEVEVSDHAEMLPPEESEDIDDDED